MWPGLKGLRTVPLEVEVEAGELYVEQEGGLVGKGKFIFSLSSESGSNVLLDRRGMGF